MPNDRSGIVAWWQRTIRRHFCWECGRTTFHRHRHDEVRLQQLLTEEWRR